jgi:predicted ester cyclase
MVEEVWNQRQPDLLREFFSPRFFDTGGKDPKVPDVEELQRQFDVTIEAFPDFNFEIDAVFSVDDSKVVLLLIFHGTNDGPLQRPGQEPLPATGRKVTSPQVTILDFADGLIVKRWHGQDYVDVLAQLGIPPPSPGGPVTPGPGH